MTYEIGKAIRLTFLTTDPATGAYVAATGVAVTVTDPTGATATPAVSTASAGSYYSDLQAAVAGQWRYRWVGTVGGIQTADEGSFYVTALSSAVPWEPTLDQVAAHVPMRTIEWGNLTGTPSGTFTGLTMPTAAQVSLYATEAVGRVLSSVGTLNAAVYDLAGSVAALWAAAQVELAQPADQFDQRRYDALLVQYDSSLKVLTDRNEVLTGGSGSAAQSLDPVWYAPDPVPWGDEVVL